jgi:translation elongation factor EF-Tu-like GTPase
MSFSFTDEEGRDSTHDAAKMIVTDMFETTDDGLISTGMVDYGIFEPGDEVLVVKTDGSGIKTTIRNIIVNRKNVSKAEPGQNVGVVLENVKRDQLGAGDYIVKV